MSELENTITKNADSLYFESVENEDGMNLNVDDQIKSNLAGLIEARYTEAELARQR